MKKVRTEINSGNVCSYKDSAMFLGLKISRNLNKRHSSQFLRTCLKINTLDMRFSQKLK
jgi:hypothetical protein